MSAISLRNGGLSKHEQRRDGATAMAGSAARAYRQARVRADTGNPGQSREIQPVACRARRLDRLARLRRSPSMFECAHLVNCVGR